MINGDVLSYFTGANIAQKVDIVLTGLSVKFESILTIALFLLKPLKMNGLVDILLECENRHKRFFLEILLQTNMVQHPPMLSNPAMTPLTVPMLESRSMGSFSHSGQGPYCSRGQSNHGHH
ncbi:hypothetical protein J1N35_014591 [Gossypium stocksii]|uniref:Uncharacterized protein n=1 Tax=Gossypium stocksii TaxID=47602 RepID=A0A9D4A930_9ROSI|nr:hypothetical protein J1N35_014591 [Gossypium stocksii]